ncbi:hypothetical protein UPYG_G00251320 [Umbra pygmaea]|uniref:Uncharacterized protein n=1 Tax=Umbra pygmaea TaxID=75934 RepID=A0ABD0W7Z8_UMBPY
MPLCGTLPSALQFFDYQQWQWSGSGWRVQVLRSVGLASIADEEEAEETATSCTISSADRLSTYTSHQVPVLEMEQRLIPFPFSDKKQFLSIKCFTLSVFILLFFLLCVSTLYISCLKILHCTGSRCGDLLDV